MLAMIGAFLGWKLMLVTLFPFIVSGLGHRDGHRRGQEGRHEYALPFGTFLAIRRHRGERGR